ncbi:type 1 fimbrial protein [Citrobacter sp. ku-bf4]|uniref:fimbrial protein n=1 Tax=Citrobacter TaxID=544 RepID=UPI001981F21D|nr:MULTISPECIES: fimbrial protein [Citrobacter]MBN6043815.1 type 1 fimbrial protein [Citrobacter sp. ku-bf4]MBS0825192.1 type 1 fimbrial protein [Citrobacter amalonaticus]
MQIAKSFFLLLVLATAALFMPHAKASCQTPNLPALLSLASISVPTSLPVGSTIPGTEHAVHVSGNCYYAPDAGQPIIACYNGFGKEIPGIPGVYETGVAGVGISLRNDKGQRVTGAADQVCSANTPIGQVSGTMNSDSSLSFSFDVTLELVKTNETVASGSLTMSNTQFNIAVSRLEGVGEPNTLSYSGNVQVKAVTCNVSPKSLTVTLGDFPVSRFTAPGTVVSQSIFNIGMLCDQDVQPEMMIASANGYETNYPGVIKLTPESGVATGVGVKILFNGQIPAFGQYMNTFTTYANIQSQYPFSVSYEQTSAEVTPGTANAVATITVAYQ